MTHIALLRGINVGGSKPLRMAELREVCAAAGLRDVQTYVQSGNLVFAAGKPTAPGLPDRIRAAIAGRWGYDVPVVVRTAGEWRAVVEECPFGAVDPASEGTRVHVAFLASAPPADGEARLAELVQAGEELVVIDREVYLRCPQGYGQTRLTNTALEKHLGVTATARNWRTVLKLLEMAG